MKRLIGRLAKTRQQSGQGDQLFTGGRQLAISQTQSALPRSIARVAMAAVIVGVNQRQLA
jgi:hypothetical protein